MLENELLTVFGKSAKVLNKIVGGMMNESYLVMYRGKKYVLYIATTQANEMVNRKLEKENQAIVASLGLTSKNYYFNTETGTKANEYIEGTSLNKCDSFNSKKIAILLKTLHTCGKKCKEDYRPFERFINYENEALSFQRLSDKDYQKLRAALFEHKDFLEKQTKTICHNDAQKSNIVKDLNDNYFLIDFEFMGNNDPIYDIATFGNGSVAEGFKVLSDYYDGKPTKEQKMRYYLWRIFVSLQWHDVAIVKHHRGEGKTHGYNFLVVANFFLANARDAYQGLMRLK